MTKNPDTENIKGYSFFPKPKNVKNVLNEYKKFEQSIGMHKIDIITLTQNIIRLSKERKNTPNNEIPKKDMQLTFNKQTGVNLSQLKKVLTQ